MARGIGFPLMSLFLFTFSVAPGKWTSVVCQPRAVSTHTAPLGPRRRGGVHTFIHSFAQHAFSHSIIKHLSSPYCGSSPRLGPANVSTMGHGPALPGLPVLWGTIPLRCEQHDSRKARQPCERLSGGQGDIGFLDMLLSLDLKVQVGLKCHHVLLEGSQEMDGPEKGKEVPRALSTSGLNPCPATDALCDLGQPTVCLWPLAILN